MSRYYRGEIEDALPMTDCVIVPMSEFERALNDNEYNGEIDAEAAAEQAATCAIYASLN